MGNAAQIIGALTSLNLQGQNVGASGSAAIVLTTRGLGDV
jgi:hypothetical protein